MKSMLLIVFLIMFFRDLNARVSISRPFPKPIPKLVIDSGKVRVWYAFNAIDINKAETYDDLQRLEIGIHTSKYYSFFVYNSDSLCTDWKNRNPNAQSSPTWMGNQGKKPYWSEYYYTDNIKDFSTGKLTEYTYMPQNM